MTKAAFEAIVAQYRDYIDGIGLDNGRFIFIGYNQTGWFGSKRPEDMPVGITMDNISVVTFGDTDFLQVKKEVKAQGSETINQITLHPLDIVQCIVIAEGDYKTDPMIMN